jgi:hypothetical protein
VPVEVGSNISKEELGRVVAQLIQKDVCLLSELSTDALTSVVRPNEDVHKRE